MHWKVRREFLARAEIFAELGRRDLRALAKSCTLSSYAVDDVLCHQGERGVAAFLIVSGRVQVENVLPGGRSIVLARLGQGEMVGELSIIDGAERVATVRAVEEVDVLVLTQWSFKALIKRRPSIAAAMLPIVVERFRETAKELRERDSAAKAAREASYH